MDQKIVLNFKTNIIVYDFGVFPMSSTESQFLVTMNNKEQYSGQWVAILDSGVIAQGKLIDEVYAEAIKISPDRTPLFVKIPDKNSKEQTLIL